MNAAICDLCGEIRNYMRSCALCIDSGHDDARFCSRCRIECEDCGTVVCKDHRSGNACQRCAMVGYESAAGAGEIGESESYREAMKQSGRGNQLR